LPFKKYIMLPSLGFLDELQSLGIIENWVLEELQLKCLPCCNWSACWVAIEVLWSVAIEVVVSLQLEHCWVIILLIKIRCPYLQLKCLRNCNWCACHVATRVLVKLQFVW
jgi:hypothetical protein